MTPRIPDPPESNREAAERAGTPESPRGTSSAWKRWLFLGVLAVYALTGAGQFQTVDAAQELGAAVSLRHGHGLRSDFPEGAGGGTTRGRDGALYAAHDIGSTLLYLPFTLIPGSSTQRVATATDTGHVGHQVLLPSKRLYFAASFAAPLLGALIVLVFACLLEELGFDPVTTTWTALALAFTTAIWVYAHVSFDSTATALAIVGTAWGAARFMRRRAPRDALLTGAFAAGALLVRIDSLVMVPFLAAPVLWTTIRDRRTRAPLDTKSLTALVGPVAAAIVIDLAYNWWRFGSILDNGHADDGYLQTNSRIGDGFFGQVASPGKGLLVFSPLLIVALFRWRWFLRRHTVFATSIAGATVATLLAHSAIVGWAGDQAWGARFTVPVIALVAIPLARVIQEIRHQRASHATRLAVIGVAAIGFVIQLSGVLVDFFAVVTARRLRGEDTTTSLWHPAYLDGLVVAGRAISHSQPHADLTVAWAQALHVARFDLWWVRAAQVSGWNVFTIGIPILTIACAVMSFRRLHRHLA